MKPSGSSIGSLVLEEADCRLRVQRAPGFGICSTNTKVQDLLLVTAAAKSEQLVDHDFL